MKLLDNTNTALGVEGLGRLLRWCRCGRFLGELLQDDLR
jgi:hypothetical protein